MSPALLTLPPMPGKSADAGYGPSAATTTASLSKGSILNDGADSTTMNVVVRDVAGNPLAGVVPTARSSGSNNTIGTFSASDALGNSSATFKSTTAETKSIIINVGRDLGAGALSLTVTSTSISVGGSVALDAGGASAGGGVVQALDGVSLSEIARATVDGSGNYSITGIASGSNVTLKYHPAHGFCLGASQADTTALGVISTNQTGKNFAEQPATLYDNFASYLSDADLRANGFLATRSVTTNPTDQDGGWGHAAQITLGAAAGPHGGPAMVYTWPDNSSSLCAGDPGNTANYNLKAQFRFNPLLSSSEWWIIFDDWMASPWQNGSASCAQTWEYKFIRFTAGGNAAVYEMLIQGGKPLPDSTHHALKMLTSVVDSVNHSQFVTTALGNPDVWPGTWRRWAIHITGHGTATPVFTVYVNGVQLGATNAPTGQTFTNSTFVDLELGANINSGPDGTGNSRKISMVQVSTTRPRLIPNEAP